MCFFLKKSDIGEEPKIAKKDIIVYKVISKLSYGWSYNLYINDKLEKWTQGYIYSESNPFDKLYFYNVIYGRCFHSSKTLELAKIIKYSDEKIVKMIIPKDSLYYENDYEYVSNIIYYPKQDKNMNLL